MAFGEILFSNNDVIFDNSLSVDKTVASFSVLALVKALVLGKGVASIRCMVSGKGVASCEASEYGVE